MTPLDARAEADRLKALFVAEGARLIEADILQPAETLLDLYGEDIRARAYVTGDPLRGEQMLRPDFTVPVVQMHMERGKAPARYTYSGKVFRRQETGEQRASEYLQVGFEVFDGANPVAADAEVFALFQRAMDGLGVEAVTGDIGLLMAAVDGLQTTEARKAALRRHIWRPRRFRALLDRFGGISEVPPTRRALLANPDPLGGAHPMIGKRTIDEIGARITALDEDAREPAISGAEIELIDALLGLKETAPNVLAALRDIAVDMPAIAPAVERMALRLDAMAERDIDVDALAFEASFGRTSMEYYDGFVFGFSHPARPDLPALATGGRYDALTTQLGDGDGIPAVGGVIRPESLLSLREGAR